MLYQRLLRLLWIFAEKFGLVFLSIFSFYVYAMVLAPEELGQGVIVLGIVELITLLFTSTVDSSFIRRDKISSQQDGTLFWGGIAVSTTFALLINFAAFLYTSDLTTRYLVLVASLLLPLQLASRVHVAHMRRQGNFKALAKRTLAGKLIGMAVGISSAYAGMGPWAVVLQAVVMQLVATSTLLLLDRRKLPFCFDWSFLQSLIVVGFPVAVKAVSWNLMNRGIVIILGITSGAAVVGYYNLANRLIELPRTAIYGGLMSYALPVFSRRKQDTDAIRNFYRQASLLSTIILAPCFVGLALVSERIVLLIFGDKWAPSIVTLQILALVAGVSLLFVFTSSVLIALKKQTMTLKAELSGTLVALIVAYFLGATYGALTGAIALCVRSLFVVPANISAMKKVIGLDVAEQAGLFVRSLGACMIMAIVVTGLNILLPAQGWTEFGIISVLGALSYMVTYSLFHMRWISDFKTFIAQS